MAKTWLKDPTEYIVTNLNYLNSEFTDYSPHFVFDGSKNSIYFSSSRTNAMGDKTHGGSGQSFADIFITHEDAKGAWSFPAPITDAINSEHEEGTPSYSTATKSLFFTRCTYHENTASLCNIMESKLVDKTWIKAELLNVSDIKRDTSDYVHPAISKNGLALYFASNRMGGFGGYDIWLCTRLSIKDPWSKPKNAGNVVNTPGDEVFPYLRNDSTYFSSNGHVGMEVYYISNKLRCKR